jgi:uncharacterized delta-60 repeat protein
VGLAAANAGALDTSFSSDGKRLQSFGNGSNTDEAFAVATDSQNRVVVGGYSVQTGGNYDFAIARYTPEGSLDTSFSSDGKRIQSFGNGTNIDEAYGVAIDSQDRPVVVGYSIQTGGTGYDFAIARYTTTGNLDSSFSGDGKQTVDFGGVDMPFGVAIDSQGRIVVAGASTAGDGYDFAVARLLSDGSLDSSFSSDGKRLQSFDNGTLLDQALAVATDSQDRVVATGYSARSSDPGDSDFAIARYTTSGSLDTSFSTDGKRLQSFGNGDEFDIGRGVAIDAQNRVVAEGATHQTSGNSFDFALARYTTSGGLDSSFSGDGKQLVEFEGGSGYAVAIDSQGRIVAAGIAASFAGGGDFGIARLLSNGSLDNSFSGDGKRLQSFDNGTDSDTARGVAIDSQDRVVAAGPSLQDGGADKDFAIARFLGG